VTKNALSVTLLDKLKEKMVEEFPINSEVQGFKVVSLSLTLSDALTGTYEHNDEI
jgi:hypothetical protein